MHLHILLPILLILWQLKLFVLKHVPFILILLPTPFIKFANGSNCFLPFLLKCPCLFILMNGCHPCSFIPLYNHFAYNPLSVSTITVQSSGMCGPTIFSNSSHKGRHAPFLHAGTIVHAIGKNNPLYTIATVSTVNFCPQCLLHLMLSLFAYLFLPIEIISHFIKLGKHFFTSSSARFFPDLSSFPL